MKDDDDDIQEYVSHRTHTTPVSRNDVLEEVAQEFDKMKAFGDTAASFAAFVRDLKT